jgi:hypothetical protein
VSRRVLVYPVIAIAWLAIALGLVACGGGGKPGDATATTGAASQVTPSSAVVSGEVNAQGQGASYYFEYGENTSYGSNTPSQNVASEAAFPVTATLSNLDPDTTYHYQLVLRTRDGKQIKGGDQTFQTAAEGGGGGGGAGGAGGTTTTTGGRATTGPTTAPLTTVQPTTAPLTTVRPTTGPYTTVRPTHGGYTTVQPTTTYTTVQPTTTYTTVQPTGPLTTVQPTTGNP